MYILSDGHDSYEPPYLITNTCTCTFRRSLRGWNGQWCMYDEKKRIDRSRGLYIISRTIVGIRRPWMCTLRGEEGLCVAPDRKLTVSFSAAFLLTRDKTYSWQWICAVSLWLLFDFFSLFSSLSLPTAAIFQTNLDDIKATFDEFNRQRRYAS